jgi:hypothetical protein
MRWDNNDGWNFQEKTLNWEGDPPGELTVPQTDTGDRKKLLRRSWDLRRRRTMNLGVQTQLEEVLGVSQTPSTFPWCYGSHGTPASITITSAAVSHLSRQGINCSNLPSRVLTGGPHHHLKINGIDTSLPPGSLVAPWQAKVELQADDPLARW